MLAGVTAGAIAADTVGMVVLVAFDLLETALVGVPPWRCPAVGVFGTGNQKADTDSEDGVVFVQVDLLMELEADNRAVVELDSEPVLVEGVQTVAGVPLGEAGQELIAGYVHQMCFQSFSNQQPLLKFSPRWTASGLTKTTLFVQAEAWPVLSGSQQVLACLLESVQTCGPALGNIK